ncbi:hypothetical protein WH91_22265 [Devosia psychrophila]|uniref:Secreted protein n=1 Tax=Devosia psychrophila TaxID=728005 RepID=A0ABR5DSI9_9HYPH|nr:hypothetical protein WH91_22265 [Devosia psychrophila]
MQHGAMLQLSLAAWASVAIAAAIWALVNANIVPAARATDNVTGSSANNSADTSTNGGAEHATACSSANYATANSADSGTLLRGGAGGH